MESYPKEVITINPVLSFALWTIQVYSRKMFLSQWLLG